MWWLIPVIIVVSVLLIIAIIIFLVVKGSFYSPNHYQKVTGNRPTDPKYKDALEVVSDYITALENEPCEDVYITSFDKKKLHARYYHYKDNGNVAILFHGYRATSIRDFSGGFWIFKKLGYNILLVDQRAHGLSKGHIITMGIKERKDAKSWAEYSGNKYPNSNIALVGISMGATTVLMASVLNLPKQVKCVLADCPYAYPRDICRKVCKEDIKIPLVLGWPFLYLGSRIMGFNLNSINLNEEIKNVKLPCLIIHGEKDGFVPPKMSKGIYENNKEFVQRYTFPNATHGMSFIIDKNRYEKLVVDFLSQHMK